MHALESLFKGFLQLQKLPVACGATGDQHVIVVGAGTLVWQGLDGGLEAAPDPVAYHRIAHGFGDSEAKSRTGRDLPFTRIRSSRLSMHRTPSISRLVNTAELFIQINPKQKGSSSAVKEKSVLDQPPRERSTSSEHACARVVAQLVELFA